MTAYWFVRIDTDAVVHIPMNDISNPTNTTSLLCILSSHLPVQIHHNWYDFSAILQRPLYDDNLL